MNCGRERHCAIRGPQVIHTPQKRFSHDVCDASVARKPDLLQKGGEIAGTFRMKKRKNSVRGFYVALQLRAREAGESLSLQHVDKDHKAAGFKCLSPSFFFSPQSLVAGIDLRGDFLGQGRGD